MSQIAISIKNLSKHYTGAKAFALDGVSFTIKKGDFYGLLGPNGSGKTTMVSIICGLIKPTSGSVTFEQFKYSEIGLVPQQIALYSKLTLLENLYLFGRLYRVPSDVLKERIEYCLDITHLSDVANEKVDTFSGGVKRRANLATSLIHAPKMLFLDEPTANVDPHTRHSIFESLTKMNNDGITILYTTHYLEEVEQLCSKVAILDYGKLIENDSIKNLFEKHPGANSLSELFLDLTGRYIRD